MKPVRIIRGPLWTPVPTFSLLTVLEHPTKNIRDVRVAYI